MTWALLSLLLKKGFLFYLIIFSIFSNSFFRKKPGQASALESEGEYLFVEQLSYDFICPVTKGVLLHPHLTSCCGNHLSEEAATRIQTEGKACPMCKEDNWTTVLNKHYQRQVQSLKVFCYHKNRGCKWEGEIVAFCCHIDSCPMQNAPLMTETV